MRSRFVYGADGVNTKASFATGWNAVNGHWPVGVVGGEEMHQLTVAEMPSHNHVGLYAEATDGDLSGGPTSGRAWQGNEPWAQNAGIVPFQGGYTGYAGGNTSHSIFPRFVTLAYIMKL